jgi:hypothetical protein
MKHHNKTVRDLEKVEHDKQVSSKVWKLQKVQKKREQKGRFINIDGDKTEIFVPEGKDEQQAIKEYKEKRKKL